MKILGHKNLYSTLIYLHLEKAPFNSENDEFNVKVAMAVEEDCKLIEVGFEHVCDMEGVKLFRQQK
jgi:hypothetical protein